MWSVFFSFLLILAMKVLILPFFDENLSFNSNFGLAIEVQLEIPSWLKISFHLLYLPFFSFLDSILVFSLV